MLKSAVLPIFVLLVALPGCRPETEESAPLDFENAPMGVIAKVKVDEAARIYLDGREVTLEELEAALAALPPKRSAVWYHRSNPLQEATPDVAAMSRQVFAAIASAKLPVSLVQEDFE